MNAITSRSSCGVGSCPPTFSGTTPSHRAARRNGRGLGQFPPIQIGGRRPAGAAREELHLFKVVHLAVVLVRLAAEQPGKHLEALVKPRRPPAIIGFLSKRFELVMARGA